MLYVVPTPIGNLQDITYRAVETLKSVALVACEDTRHTKILLDHYGINTPTTSFYQHNQLTKAEHLLSLLREGKDVALVSDAGMPGILDPGYSIINMAVRQGIPVTVLPGACALVNALVLSGKPAHEFHFEGFLPPRRQARRNRLQLLSQKECTVVFYESCHRIIPCLEDVRGIFAGKEVVACRELTKKFEEAMRGTADELLQRLAAQKPRGEFVVVI